MSETVKLEQKSIQGPIEQINKIGIKVRGAWYDYVPGFKGERLDGESVGQEVELALVDSTKKKGKLFISALEILDAELPEAKDEGETPESEPEEASAESTPHAAGPGDGAASDKTLQYAKDLAGKAGLSEEDVESILRIRFKKSLDGLTQGEASKAVVFFGGYTPTRGRSSRQ